MMHVNNAFRKRVQSISFRICFKIKPSDPPTLQIWYRGYDLNRKKFEIADICFVHVEVNCLI